jgi:thiamine biosynthesis lipoprotein
MCRRLWHPTIVALLLAWLVPAAGLAQAQPALERFEGVEPHMGTLARITVYATDAASARVALRAGFDRIAAVNAALSDYLPDSELSRVTRDAVGRDVPIGNDLCRVLSRAQALAEATEGAFDVTQGPVIRLWREARKAKRLPDPAALEEAARRTGYRHMRLDASRCVVAFDQAGMQLDVGGIGKGYAASEALAAISALGVRSALVAISGDLAFSDAPPGLPGWRIRVHDGDLGDVGVPAVLRLANAAVSTSGNSEQHLDVDGRRYSHVIDPTSRMGLVDDITVTVIASHGVDADGLDTTMGILGAERGLALVERDPEAAALVVVRKDGQVSTRVSRRMREIAATQR